MATQLTSNGIKFGNIEKEQTKAFLTVDSIGPDANGNIPLDLTSITDSLDDLEQRLIDLQNGASTYTLVATPSTTNPIGEGTVFTITLNTTNVFNGEEIPYTITTDGVSLTDDFNSPVASSGYFKVENNTASWQVTIKSDELTEPSSESFTLTLNAGDNPSVTVNVNDTSTTPQITDISPYLDIQSTRLQATGQSFVYQPYDFNLSDGNVEEGFGLFFGFRVPKSLNLETIDFDINSVSVFGTPLTTSDFTLLIADNTVPSSLTGSIPSTPDYSSGTEHTYSEDYETFKIQMYFIIDNLSEDWTVDFGFGTSTGTETFTINFTNPNIQTVSVNVMVWDENKAPVLVES